MWHRLKAALKWVWRPSSESAMLLLAVLALDLDEEHLKAGAEMLESDLRFRRKRRDGWPRAD